MSINKSLLFSPVGIFKVVKRVVLSVLLAVGLSADVGLAQEDDEFRTIVVGRIEDAKGDVLRLVGGRTREDDTIYVLKNPPSLASPDDPWYGVSVHITDGPGDALFELGRTDDILRLGPGGDTGKTGCGDDVVYAGSGEDQVTLGCGADLAFGGTGADILVGGYGPDEIHGGSEADIIYGGKGADVLYSDDGDDLLFGQEGNDILIHNGSGVVTMIGGEGADTFYTRTGDRVIDFNPEEGDRLFIDQEEVTYE